ncbi:MAG: saccharopine dehydrogenase [Bacteroidales bacterium]|nr:saccharopine dehydrogenase [Bacteroidales bacterium]
MKRILILGAGLSATSLIDYLISKSEIFDWKIVIGDMDIALAEKKTNNHPNAKAVRFDTNEIEKIESLVSGMDVVVSMLPARFHDLIAAECLKQGINMATASYVSPYLLQIDEELKAKSLTFLNELGLDPGIDHMSAMQVIDRIRAKGGRLTAFYSFTGGLIAPESDDNPWNYKFTWNPRNVVLAGQGVSQYIINGRYKYIPYHKLFERVMPRTVLNFGEFEVYPNRDSLKYRKIYDIENIQTMMRGTMRRPGYCEAWNVFVQLGCTDDTYTIENSEKMTYRDFINSFLRYDLVKPVEEKLCENLNLDPDGETMSKLKWLGIFEDKPILLNNASPAQILQKLLESKLSLNKHDKDMIVMQHEFEYLLDNKLHKIVSAMGYIGKDTVNTAMSITVGTPLAIAVKLLLTDKISSKGVIIPTKPELYEPILAEMEDYGIRFIEKESVVD